MLIINVCFVNMILLQEWFEHPSWWFDATEQNDAYITEKYEHLLKGSESSISVKVPLEKVIIYDQLPRHVFRNQSAAHVIEYFLQKAVDIALDTIVDEEYMNNLSCQQWCFMLLPLRHTKELPHIFTVMRMCWDKLRRVEGTENKLAIKRFMRATYARCPIDKYACAQAQSHGECKDIMKYNDILNVEPCMLDGGGSGGCKLDKAAIEVAFHNGKMILSLSGGVDSMVCSYLMSTLVRKEQWVAVHINYCNRKTAYDEEGFITEWCAILDIPLYVRRITEIQRDPCMKNDMRDLYETYTRNVRYTTYKSVARDVWGGDVDYAVVMGHNKDDCLENILTNIAHGDHYDNLKGMSKSAVQDGITFFRPLLEIPKDVIKAYARRYDIPHLPNSTPIWSQRGKIRAKITPVMDAWDPRFIPAMFKLSERVSELQKIFDGVVEGFVASKTNGGVIEIPVAQLNTSAMFWKQVVWKLRQVIISERSLKNMENRLEQWVKAGALKTDDTKCKILLHKHVTIVFKKIDADILSILIS